ncbi:S-layer homology domain-containing protein [Sporosarcina highlanderae]|uniref:S-layer homology domain-containing protein n=1 Tax=Sporosarcina highlanderae TaxID=3035916 RepID=A0ABT8JLB8_9BACL|nr:S-layer homology domain-containing protein [Sporosarcina highlanderae]MDN4605945.1 S-layer homology domain-containing protein [Sporosarcina highlanderae]
MTTKNNSSKVLKATMIGAVALTPVLAVGVTADAAVTNPKVNKLITNLDQALNKLDKDEVDLLRSAHKKVLAQLADGKWKDTDILTDAVKDGGEREEAANKVINALVTFMASSITAVDMEKAFEAFDDTVADSDLKVAFGTEITKAQFIDFLVDVQNEVLTSKVEVSQLQRFISALNKVANKDVYENIYDGIWNSVHVLKMGDALTSVVADVTSAEKAAFVKLATEYNNIVNPGPGPGPGPGPVIPPTTPPATGDNAVEVDGSAVVSNPQAVIDAIEKAAKVEQLIVKVQSGTTVADIPATILNALSKKNSNAVIVLQFGDVAYELPVDAFDLAAIAKDLDVASAELKLNVSVKKVDNPLAGKAAYKVLADAFDFNVSVVAPGGKSVALTVFPTPVKRSVPAANELNPLTTVGVTVDAKGNVTAVPTYVTNDKKSANLYRSTNSVYTLIEHSKSFTDITAGTSWAEEYVDKLASRMVVNGVTATEYAPTKMITRGEFAAILSRGLGIVAMDKTANVFADVSASQAFNKNGEIAAVVEAGIVAGFTDGTFRPYEEITRDQAAIMISRAIDYVGADKVTFDTKKALTAFKDNKDIGAASRKHVERVYQAGLLDGYLDDTFRPNADANRAQMAKIIYNFLAEIKFIN